MTSYIHKVRYYETDKMGITHHSNYIRFMEEARMHFLAELGWPMTRIEAVGITSPVVSVTCKYENTTTYDDEIEILVQLEHYSGVRLELSYLLRDFKSGKPVAHAASSHCFVGTAQMPVSLKKHLPALDCALRNNLEAKAK